MENYLNMCLMERKYQKKHTKNYLWEHVALFSDSLNSRVA